MGRCWENVFLGVFFLQMIPRASSYEGRMDGFSMVFS